MDFVGTRVTVAGWQHPGLANDYIDVFLLRGGLPQMYGCSIRKNFNPYKEIYPGRTFADTVHVAHTVPLREAIKRAQSAARSEGLVLLLQEEVENHFERRIIWHPSRWLPKYDEKISI